MTKDSRKAPSRHDSLLRNASKPQGARLLARAYGLPLGESSERLGDVLRAARAYGGTLTAAEALAAAERQGRAVRDEYVLHADYAWLETRMAMGDHFGRELERKLQLIERWRKSRMLYAEVKKLLK